MEQMLAFRGVYNLVVHVNAPTNMWLLNGRFTKGKVVPGVVGYIMGPPGSVDPEKMK